MPDSFKPEAALAQAIAQIDAARADAALCPLIASFFDQATNTASYVVHDSASGEAAIIDSVLDYDAASGRTSTTSAQRIIEHVAAHKLTVVLHIETHAHADHLSAATFLKKTLGGKLAIGNGITRVQEIFAPLFNMDSESADGEPTFDLLLNDGEMFSIGVLSGIALHVPGHTPADMAFVIGDAAFVGDTLFMPDYGTARADFPGADAGQLYRSIQRLLRLPRETRLFLCHDYKAPGRDHFAWETTVAAQRDDNVHIRDGISEDAFVAMRTERDRTLSVPKLLLPAVQVNIRGGRLPEPDDNGIRYIKIPLNVV